MQLDEEIVTILEENPLISVCEIALLSEPAPTEDWLRPEENETGLHL